MDRYYFQDGRARFDRQQQTRESGVGKQCISAAPRPLHGHGDEKERTVPGSRHVVPASFFGMVLGIVGLGSSWRIAANLWNVSASIGQGILMIAGVVWALLAVGYLNKWIRHRDAVLAESRHAIQCCFISLIPASTTLMGIVLQPGSRALAVLAWAAGSLGQLAFALYRSGGMWRGERDIATITPVLFLPTVTSNSISSIVAGKLGFHSFGIVFFGAGLFQWLVIESIVLLRLWIAPEMPEKLRPTLGIALAPAAVCALAYLNNTSGPPDILPKALCGYALLQLLILCRLLPWIMREPLSPSYWSFTFGLTAVSTDLLEMTRRGASGFMAMAAMPVFVATNAVVVSLALTTLWHLARSGLPSAMDSRAAPH